MISLTMLSSVSEIDLVNRNRGEFAWVQPAYLGRLEYQADLSDYRPDLNENFCAVWLVIETLLPGQRPIFAYGPMPHGRGYNALTMKRKIAILLLSLSTAWTQKRPLTHDDYDSWNHIQNQQLSPDGRYLAYAVFPEVGDGNLVLRDLKTKKDVRQPIGELPPPPRPNYAIPQNEDIPVPPPGIAVKFSSDSSTLVFSTFPTHEDVEKAKRAKKKPEDMPHGDLVVIKLASAEVFRAPSVKTFQLPTKAAGFVAYLQQLPGQTMEEKSANPAKPKKIETGDLVLRNLRDGTERKFADVSEYTLTNDGNLLVDSVFSRTPDANGVYW